MYEIGLCMKSGLVYEIPCCDCDVVYTIGEKGRILETRKREHFNAIKIIDVKKVSFVPTYRRFEYFIAWDAAKI